MSMTTSRLRHLIAGNGERRTRLHTQRGDLIKFSELRSASRSIAARRRGTAPTGPWMVDEAIAELDQQLRPTDRLLELGSGTSTIWYARRVRQVVSIEPDPVWYAKTKSALAGGVAPHVRLVNDDVGDAIRELIARGETFDVVIVDSTDTETWTRVDGARAALTLVGAAGIVVLDDSDRPAYASIDQMFAGWSVRRYRGIKPRPLEYVETTVYSKRR